MGQSIYYHNVTQSAYNINDLQDATEMADPKDVIKFSERGCAIVYDIRTKEKDESNEYDLLRKEFYKYFKEFHEEDFK